MPEQVSALVLRSAKPWYIPERWTVFTPSVDTRLVNVGSDGGNDTTADCYSRDDAAIGSESVMCYLLFCFLGTCTLVQEQNIVSQSTMTWK